MFRAQFLAKPIAELQTVNWATTLDSGIDVAPGINVAHPLKNFHITILILFYTNLGIAVIFYFIFSSKFFKN